MLAQQNFALALVEGRFGLLADLVRQPQHLNAMREHARNLLHPRRDVDGLQDLLLLLRRHIHVGRGHIGQCGRRIDVLECSLQFRRRLRQKLNGLGRLSLKVKETCFDFRRLRVRLGNPQDTRHEKRPAVEEFDNLESLIALAHEMMRPIRRGDVTHDIRDRTHRVHIDDGRLGDVGVALHQDADLPLLTHRLLSRTYRALTPDRDRQHETGKQDGIADRNDDERIWRQWGQRGFSAPHALVRGSWLSVRHGMFLTSAK